MENNFKYYNTDNEPEDKKYFAAKNEDNEVEKNNSSSASELKKNVTKYISIVSLNRFSLFLFSMITALFFLYVFGNMQDFLDESQLIILHILVGISLILFIVSLGAFGVNIILYSQIARKKFILNFLFHFIMGFIGLFFAFIYTSIIVVSGSSFLF